MLAVHDLVNIKNIQIFSLILLPNAKGIFKNFLVDITNNDLLY